MPAVRCVRCGYENHLHQRFCGMCGRSLVSRYVTPDQPSPAPPREAAHPEPLAAPRTLPPPQSANPASREDPPPSAGVPSFLGLGQPPSDSVDYLFEDSEGRDYGRVYALLIALVLIAGIVLSVWFLRREPSGWLGSQIARVKAVAAPVGESAASAGSSSSDAASSAPAQPQPPAGDTSAQDNSHEPAKLQPQSDPSPPPVPAADESAKASPPEAVTPPPAASRRTPSAAKDSKEQDALVTEGENYLYGHHAPQDCGRARHNLMSAAEAFNPRALTLLGTMYATGHCVPRNMPLAYQWFTQAHQQDPHNGRVEQDLRLVWNQMTAQEQNSVSAKPR